MTLREHIDALHVAGATGVTVHPDGSVTATFPPKDQPKTSGQSLSDCALDQMLPAPANHEYRVFCFCNRCAGARYQTSRGGTLP